MVPIFPLADLQTYKPKTCKPTNLKPSKTYKPTNLKPKTLQTYKPANLQTYKPANLQTYKPTNMQTCKPANLNTYIKTCKPSTCKLVNLISGLMIGSMLNRTTANHPPHRDDQPNPVYSWLHHFQGRKHPHYTLLLLSQLDPSKEHPHFNHIYQSQKR